MRRLLVALAVAACAFAGWAKPALAHAVLQSTDPPAGAVLDHSPGTVALHFGEDVEIRFGAIRVFNRDGKRVDLGNAFHPVGDGHAAAIAVPASLAAGGYVVTWRVVSADAHPVHGAFTFQIGAGGAGAAESTKAEAAKLLAASGRNQAVGVTFGVIRFLAFASLFVLVGGGAFVAGGWRPGVAEVRVRRLLWAGWATAVATTGLAICVQGPYGAALPLARMFSPAVVSAVAHTRFGEVYLARLIILVLLAGPLLGVLLGRPDTTPRWWTPAALATGAAVLVTPGLAGHAASGSLVALAIPFDLVHVAGAAVWLGGLSVLAVAVLVPGQVGAKRPLSPVARRFSTWALGAVMAIAVTGGFAAWRQVGSLSAVTTTTFGRLVLAKTIMFAVLVGVATSSRRLVHRSLGLPFGLGRGSARVTAAAAAARPGRGDGATGPTGPGDVVTAPEPAAASAAVRSGAEPLRLAVQPQPGAKRIPARPRRRTIGAPTGRDPATARATARATSRATTRCAALPAAGGAAGGAVGGAVVRPGRGLDRRARLRRSVLLELALAAAVLAVTAVLVNAQPARQIGSEPFSAEVHAGPDVLVDVVVDPARAGPVAVHLYTLSADGSQLDVTNVSAAFSLPPAGIANLAVPLNQAGPGHFSVYGFVVPIRGTWKLNMTIHTGAFTEVYADPVTVRIR